MAEDTRLKTPAGESAMESAPLRAARVAVVDAAGNQVTSFGGGTQYTEGDVDTSITGTAAMMEVAGNVLQPIQGSVAGGLLVTEVNSAASAASLSVLDDWDESDRLKANIITGQAGVAGGAGAVGATVQRVTLASDDPAVVSVQLIDDAIVADDAAFTPATTKVMMVGLEADETGTDSVDEGDAGAARMTLDRKVIVTLQPHTAGGLLISRDLDLDNGTLTVVKNSAGQLYGYTITNTSVVTVFVKFYDAASGTLGTGTPVLTIGIPGNATDDTMAMQSFGGLGIAFATGICVGAGTGVADNDNTDPGTNAVVANIYYK